MNKWICALALTAAGCVHSSQVVPVGDNRYMVTNSVDACGNCTPPQIRTAEQANAYCAALSKKMEVISQEEQTFDISFGHRITLTFACK